VNVNLSNLKEKYLSHNKKGKYLLQEVIRLPDMLRPNSPNRGRAEQILLEEMKKFEEQEDKTLNIHEPHRKEKTKTGIFVISNKSLMASLLF